MTTTAMAEPVVATTAARQDLFQMTMGALMAQMLHVAAKLEIADLVHAGPRGASDLATATGTDASALHRLLRALASVGVFTEVRPGWFGQTPRSDLLRRDAPGSFRAMPIYLGEELYQVFSRLLDSVRSGEPVFADIFGADYFTYLAANPAAGQTFNAAMTALGAVAETGAVVAAYDFSRARRIVDVGGGHGDLIAAVLAANPEASGVLFDLPKVIDAARVADSAASLTGRCEFVSGDFFASVPTGGDLYLLKRIIHDWDDARSVAILRQCRAAMSTDGTLLIIEDALPDGDTPSPGKLVDVVLMGILPGRERTAAEYRALCQDAGLRLERIVATSSAMAIMVVVPG
ncbi:MAG: methyltransferase [Thermomicrobiales bacterium]